VSALTREELMTMQTLLLKVPEVAAHLGISRTKVYELIASGALPAVKLDGSRRIRACDLEEFVQRLTDCTQRRRRGQPVETIGGR